MVTLARARTLTALRELDPERKGHLLGFLYEARLIGFELWGETYDSILSLSGANLHGALLSGALLGGADLSIVDLSGANLSGARDLTQQQLDQVSTCNGASLPKGLICHHNQWDTTMPDGPKHP